MQIGGCGHRDDVAEIIDPDSVHQPFRSPGPSIPVDITLPELPVVPDPAAGDSVGLLAQPVVGRSDVPWALEKTSAIPAAVKINNAPQTR